MSRLVPEDYATMTPDQLRESIQKKQDAMNELSHRAEGLEFDLRKKTEEARRLEIKLEELTTKLAASRGENDHLLSEWSAARSLAALLYEKVLLLTKDEGHFEKLFTKAVQHVVKAEASKPRKPKAKKPQEGL